MSIILKHSKKIDERLLLIASIEKKMRKLVKTIKDERKLVEKSYRKYERFLNIYNNNIQMLTEFTRKRDEYVKELKTSEMQTPI